MGFIRLNNNVPREEIVKHISSQLSNTAMGILFAFLIFEFFGYNKSSRISVTLLALGLVSISTFLTFKYLGKK